MEKNNIFKKFFDGSKKLFNANKKLFIASIFLIVMVIAIFVSTFFSGSKKKESVNQTEANVSISDYSKTIESKLTSMILSVESVTKVSVFVMVEASAEVKYLTETQTQKSTNSSGTTTETISTTVVFEKNGSVSTPVVVTTLVPKVTGVMIVTNKISPSTKVGIINALSVVLNIDSSRICILQEN